MSGHMCLIEIYCYYFALNSNSQISFKTNLESTFDQKAMWCANPHASYSFEVIS